MSQKIETFSLFPAGVRKLIRVFRVIGKNNSLKSRDKEGVLEFMVKNKTEWSLRVFEDNRCVKYPKHIYENIKE